MADFTKHLSLPPLQSQSNPILHVTPTFLKSIYSNNYNKSMFSVKYQNTSYYRSAVAGWTKVHHSVCQDPYFTFTFMHLANAFIQSHSQVATFFFCPYVCSPGIEPTTFYAANTMLHHWATGIFSKWDLFKLKCGVMSALGYYSATKRDYGILIVI